MPPSPFRRRGAAAVNDIRTALGVRGPARAAPHEQWLPGWRGGRAGDLDREGGGPSSDETEPDAAQPYFGAEVASKFRVTVGAMKEGRKMSRSVDPKLTYTEFAGNRFPTLSTAENLPHTYWLERGVDRLKPRTSPLHLPWALKLHPFMRQLIGILRALDPIRFSYGRIAERYGLSEDVVKQICHAQRQKRLLDDLGVSPLHVRLAERAAVDAKKEQAYAARLGYEVLGSTPGVQRRGGRRNRRSIRGLRSVDPLLKQAVVAEHFSAFPAISLPGTREPETRFADVDVEVENTPQHVILNWIDPSDKTAI